MYVLLNLDCSRFATTFSSTTPSFRLSELPSTINTNANVTLSCNASVVTKNASLSWIVDGVTYNTTGIYNSSRGQLMIRHSVFDASKCTTSSSLSILNVQSSSQGAYTCTLHDNNFTTNASRLLMLNGQSSTEGTHTSIHMHIYPQGIIYNVSLRRGKTVM